MAEESAPTTESAPAASPQSPDDFLTQLDIQNQDPEATPAAPAAPASTAPATGYQRPPQFKDEAGLYKSWQDSQSYISKLKEVLKAHGIGEGQKPATQIPAATASQEDNPVIKQIMNDHLKSAVAKEYPEFDLDKNNDDLVKELDLFSPEARRRDPVGCLLRAVKNVVSPQVLAARAQQRERERLDAGTEASAGSGQIPAGPKDEIDKLMELNRSNVDL